MMRIMDYGKVVLLFQVKMMVMFMMSKITGLNFDDQNEDKEADVKKDERI